MTKHSDQLNRIHDTLKVVWDLLATLKAQPFGTEDVSRLSTPGNPVPAQTNAIRHLASAVETLEAVVRDKACQHQYEQGKCVLCGREEEKSTERGLDRVRGMVASLIERVERLEGQTPKE